MTVVRETGLIGRALDRRSGVAGVWHNAGVAQLRTITCRPVAAVSIHKAYFSGVGRLVAERIVGVDAWIGVGLEYAVSGGSVARLHSVAEFAVGAQGVIG